MSLPELFKRFLKKKEEKREEKKNVRVPEIVYLLDRRRFFVKHLLKVKRVKDFNVVYGIPLPKGEDTIRRMYARIYPFLIPNEDSPRVSLHALSLLWRDKKHSPLPDFGREVERTLVRATNVNPEFLTSSAFKRASESPEVVSSPVVEEIASSLDTPTFSELYERFRSFKEQIEFLDEDILLSSEESIEVVRLFSSLPLYPRFRNLILFSLLALEKFGKDLPSALSADKLTKDTYGDLFAPSSGSSLLSVFTRVPLFVHVIGATLYSLKDLLSKVEMKSLDERLAFYVALGVLLHDIGKIPIYRGETKASSHAELSARIASEISFIPEEVDFAIRYHHTKPELEEDNEEEETLKKEVHKLVKGYDRLHRSAELKVVSNEDAQVPDAIPPSSLMDKHFVFIAEMLGKYTVSYQPPEVSHEEKKVSEAEKKLKIFIDRCEKGKVKLPEGVKKEGRKLLFPDEKVFRTLVNLSKSDLEKLIELKKIKKSGNYIVVTF